MIDELDVTACACANLRKVTRMVTQAYDAALKPIGLTVTQFTVLATLDKTGALPLSQLADILMMERTTLTRNLQPLMKKGWVNETAGTDQRVRHIVLAKEGQKTLSEALPAWQAVQKQIVHTLGIDQFEGLLGSLEATLDALPQS